LRRASGRRLAYGHLERALGYYSRYRRGEWVPHVYRAYLGALEEERAIEGYVTGLGGNERRAVGMYLDGKSARVIARDAEIVRGGAGLQDVRVWVYGSGERFGLPWRQEHGKGVYGEAPWECLSAQGDLGGGEEKGERERVKSWRRGKD